jgi:hypothetical protein
MVWSLGVLLVPILLVILIGRLFYGDTTTATVDPSVALQGAARAGMQPIPAATAPDGWKIVSAQFQDGVLRIGYLNPADKGVQLVQGPAKTLIADEIGGDAHPVSDVRAGGTVWRVWDARNAISALTRTDGQTAIIVLGSVSKDDLARLAGSVTVARE